MKVEDELRMLNDELIEEVGNSKVKIAQLEVLVDELTERIDNLVAECEDLEGAEEQNKLLRQLLKVVL